MFEEGMIHISHIAAVCRFTGVAEEKGRTCRYPIAEAHHGELIFFFSGSSTTFYDGVLIEDRANSVRYLPCYASRGEYKVTNHESGSCIDIFFDTVEEMPHIARGFYDQAALADSFLKIYTLWCNKRAGYYAKAMSVFYDILYQLGKTAAYLPGKKRERLEPAYRYLCENYASPSFDYRALCAAAGFSSYSYFSRLFCECYRMSPVQYVTRLRIERAKELLATGRYSVTAVAAMCGFENVYYFSRVFKEQVGLPPKDYR